MLRQRHKFFRSLLVAADTALVAGAVVAAYFTRFHALAGSFPPPDAGAVRYATHALPMTTVVPLVLLAMWWNGLYRPRRDRRLIGEGWLILKSVTIGTALAFGTIQFFSKVAYEGRDFSRLQYLAFVVLAFALLSAWRISFRAGLRVARRRGWNLRHVAIIGTGRAGQAIHDALSRNAWTGIRPTYFISHHPTTTCDRCRGLPVFGGLDDLEATLDAHPVSGVFVAMQGRLAADLPSLLRRLERSPVDVRIVPDVNPKYMPLNMAVSELEGMPILSIRESPLNGWGGVAKRAVDVAGGIAALLVFALPMLAIAALVRQSGPGPILFRQERMSLNGRRFVLYKFRTMSWIPPEELAARDAGRGTEAWTRPGDVRITRLGRLLRRTSLDELPQLFNVIKGEMSLVGPRPERPELIRSFREDRRGYMLRQNVKSGMTGWAQVNGLRGDTSLDKRLQYDLFYIRNWSLGLDLRILWMTVFRGFVHPNAG